MSLPTFTLKSLMVSMTWMCIGLGAIAFSLRGAQDGGWEQGVRGVALVVGVFCTYGGLMRLFTKRHVIPVIALGLGGLAFGIIVFGILCEFLLHEEWNGPIGGAGAVLMAFVFPPLADLIDWMRDGSIHNE